jgi:hypothetical protein
MEAYPISMSVRIRRGFAEYGRRPVIVVIGLLLMLCCCCTTMVFLLSGDFDLSVSSLVNDFIMWAMP